MKLSRFALRSVVLLMFLGLTGLMFIGGALLAMKWVYGPELPDVATIRELPLQVPLRIYTQDGVLIGEFGAERRAPLHYDQMPEKLIQAFISAEDDRFFQHPGVDYHGLLRAAWQLLRTGHRSQGGSTITMQLARNFFLSNERTFTRKFKEILLALQMEKELSKEQILETYLNKIYLGNRAYGVGAAAQVYFAKTVDQLSLSEIGILAGLPKAPSRDNPAASTQRSRNRRNYVLRRMNELGYITDAQAQDARSEPVRPAHQNTNVAVEAHYISEMVRSELYEKYGESLYTEGYEVITTIDSTRQQAAVAGLRGALFAYDQRHGYRGPESRTDPVTIQAGVAIGDEVLERLDERPYIPGTEVVLVSSITEQGIHALNRVRTSILIPPTGYEWARFDTSNALQVGDIIRVQADQDKQFRLVQLPDVQGAFVSIDPHNGSIQALVGGFDFFLGKFNRAVQARRQPGSGFKPFLYSSALAHGFSPASIILDAPVVFDDPTLEDTWRPQNYSGKFYGPTRLREALVHSRNLVSIRVLQAIGIGYARRFISKFGFPLDRMPKDLSLALGSPAFTPMEMASAYSVLANDGFKTTPYFIDEIRSAYGDLIFKAEPAIACVPCEKNALGRIEAKLGEPEQVPVKLAERVIDERTVYLMNDILHDVTTRGTGARARQLGRSDLHGKTGTTNDEADAWFYGFTPTLVGVAWVGFDQPSPLGRGEVGGRAALPMWMDYMRIALKDVPEVSFDRPDGLVNVRINPINGKLAAAGEKAIFEVVQSEQIPEPDDTVSSNPYQPDRQDDASVEDIF